MFLKPIDDDRREECSQLFFRCVCTVLVSNVIFGCGKGGRLTFFLKHVFTARGSKTIFVSRFDRVGVHFRGPGRAFGVLGVPLAEKWGCPYGVLGAPLLEIGSI